MEKALDNRRMFLFLLALTVGSGLGMQGWSALFNNFAVEVAGFNGFQTGLAQSVREVPGFLSLLVIYVLLVISERRLAALSVLLLGCGVASVGFLPSFWGVLLTTLILSFGFHYYETVNQSLTLQYFSLSEAHRPGPPALGRVPTNTPWRGGLAWRTGSATPDIRLIGGLVRPWGPGPGSRTHDAPPRASAAPDPPEALLAFLRLSFWAGQTAESSWLRGLLLVRIASTWARSRPVRADNT
jgi:hypothetical protein